MKGFLIFEEILRLICKRVLNFEGNFLKSSMQNCIFMV